jgi:hypothetical protein
MEVKTQPAGAVRVMEPFSDAVPQIVPDAPGLALKLTVPPTQTGLLLVGATTGTGLTVTVTLADVLQPVA